jgi:hypothetical protein
MDSAKKDLDKNYDDITKLDISEVFTNLYNKYS